MRSCLLLLATSACGFNVAASGGGGDSGPDSSIDSAIDASIDTPGEEGDVDLIPPAEEHGGTGNWTVDNVTIDTTALSTSVPFPNGVTLMQGAQTSGGEIAVLRVNDLKVNAGNTMRITGRRPFVIISEHDVTIAGTIDIGARGPVAGAGGSGPSTGTGAGGDGAHVDPDDSGGGGGGFGSIGGSGGSTGLSTGGSAGAAYAIAFLGGGSGGGGPPPNISCSNRGGGGGGAILIYAAHKIDVMGAITAGGGGGEAGILCPIPSNYGAGAGGGAGGMIHLQTPDMKGNGILAANGGAGGGADCTTGAPPTDGEDGKATTAMAARGGIGADCGSAGGDGAVGSTAAGTPLVATTNGGGGGGGVGRIKIHTPGSVTVTASPPPIIVP